MVLYILTFSLLSQLLQTTQTNLCNTPKLDRNTIGTLVRREEGGTIVVDKDLNQDDRVLFQEPTSLLASADM
jgi:hypothetical protein